ncbi:hypothetical protein P5V93_22175 [Mycobacteroides abscessus subsp. abscessus]|uniref:hypothetical protein n=1 Tax=Mycobacteroides abscessus TaxID=36809 RepID=UPI00092A5AAD|nr:hypothetical protein [Mycobacteroides abscessus]AWG48043.1 hypothetical protein DDT48_00540 [Mycobacteroides abscessus]MBE5451393.1 hypothetical protein [Mycobacteroides abscessus]MBN7495516.1 hypothetical protein [Mycobacteroides abscessus subsp. abscessus]MDM2170850.1 hypothetical protein [Mycobacteroides abscessus]MDM2176158.1 hypothetical protein [Mycobacteroides abscessus]
MGVQRRITRRLALGEAAGAVLLAAMTLPFAAPWAGAPPLWAQLLGLMFLLTVLAANLYSVRRIRPTVTLANFNDVLRLRLTIGIYGVTAFVLIPLPPSWGWFWFGLTVLGALLSSAGLVWMLRSDPFR